jgi:hypothetical protein
MSTVKKFEDLEVWKLARKLCHEIFQLILYETFSKDFGLKKITNLIIYLKNSEIKGNKYKTISPYKNELPQQKKQ